MVDFTVLSLFLFVLLFCSVLFRIKLQNQNQTKQTQKYSNQKEKGKSIQPRKTEEVVLVWHPQLDASIQCGRSKSDTRNMFFTPKKFAVGFVLRKGLILTSGCGPGSAFLLLKYSPSPLFKKICITPAHSFTCLCATVQC